MNKGGYSTPPQYRNNDYRYPPGPSRYQPYSHPPPDRFDSRQRPVMHQNDYYPEVNYPSPRRSPDLPPRDDIPPFSRGRGRDRDFSGNQYRPSPPPPGPPLNPQFRDYPPPRYPHPPPYNINNSNSGSNNNNSNTNNTNNNNHQNYSPRDRPPPEYPMRDFHYRQESPKPPPPPIKQHPPNSPNLNFDNFNRMIPPDTRLPPNLPPQFHRNNDFPITPPNMDDHPNHPPPHPNHPTHPNHPPPHPNLPPHSPHPVHPHQPHPNPPQFQINSPPRTPIHMMPPKQNLPIPPNFHLVMSPMPVLLNPAEIESQKLEYEELSSHIVLERELDYKKYLYDKACRKIDIVQAKLDAVMNKLSELEAENSPNSLSSSSSSSL